MSILKTLTSIMTLVVIYNGLVAPVISIITTKVKTVNTPSAKKKSKTFSDILRRTALLAFIGLVATLICIVPSTLAVLISAFGILSWIAALFLSSKVMLSVALSKGSDPLSDAEDTSFVFIGTVLWLIGLIISRSDIGYIKIFLSQHILFNYFILIIVYAVYIFVIVALSVRPLKDLSKIIIGLSNKFGGQYKKIRKLVIDKSDFQNSTRHAYSERRIQRLQALKGWRKLQQLVYLIFWVSFDVIIYIIEYILKLIIWMPLLFVLSIFQVVISFFLWAARIFCELSSRQIIIVAFRAAIIIALLIIVIHNRLAVASDSEATTAILEFVASVIIIPVMFDWIHETLHNKRDI